MGACTDDDKTDAGARHCGNYPTARTAQTLSAWRSAWFQLLKPPSLINACTACAPATTQRMNAICTRTPGRPQIAPGRVRGIQPRPTWHNAKAPQHSILTSMSALRYQTQAAIDVIQHMAIPNVPPAAQSAHRERRPPICSFCYIGGYLHWRGGGQATSEVPLY